MQLLTGQRPFLHSRVILRAFRGGDAKTRHVPVLKLCISLTAPINVDYRAHDKRCLPTQYESGRDCICYAMCVRRFRAEDFVGRWDGEDWLDFTPLIGT